MVTEEPTVAEAPGVHRSLHEERQEDGTYLYDYVSEYHSIKVAAAPGRTNAQTAAMLRKLATWVETTHPGDDALTLTPF